MDVLKNNDKDYDFPIELTIDDIKNKYFKGARVSLVGRNLLFLSNKAKTLDPELIVGTATNAEGFESFAPPTSRSFGLNLQLNF